MPRCVVLWTTSIIKDEKCAAKFHYIKTLSSRVVAQSIAFLVVSVYWQGVAPFPRYLNAKDRPALEARELFIPIRQVARPSVGSCIVKVRCGNENFDP